MPDMLDGFGILAQAKMQGLWKVCGAGFVLIVGMIFLHSCWFHVWISRGVGLGALWIIGCGRLVSGGVNFSVFVCGESAVYQHILQVFVSSV